MLVTLYKSHDSTDITLSRTLPSHIGSCFLLFGAFSPFIILHFSSDPGLSCHASPLESM